MSASRLPRLPLRATLALGVIASLASIVAAILAPRDFFVAYLVAYVFWWSIALGALAMGLFHALTGGTWGDAARPVFAAAARTLPALAFLFVPVLIGLEAIYPWTQGEPEAPASYLNNGAFIVRAVVYFAIWISLALPWTRGALADRARPRLAAVGLVLYAFSATFAAIDWIMSLAQPWHSSSFGMLIALGQALSAVALAIVVLGWVIPDISARAWHQLGNVLLALVLLWSYVAFTQYLTIWSADLPHEVTWYLDRRSNGWQWLAGMVIAFHFAVPFLLLLSRAVTRNAARLRGVALALLAAHVLNVAWLIVPSVMPTLSLAAIGTQAAAFLALGGLWCAALFYYLRRDVVLPARARGPT